MATYEVKIYETIVHTIEVEADDQEKAVVLAYKQYGEGDEKNIVVDGVTEHIIESEGSNAHNFREI
jgi:TolB-like protein